MNKWKIEYVKLNFVKLVLLSATRMSADIMAEAGWSWLMKLAWILNWNNFQDQVRAKILSPKILIKS